MLLATQAIAALASPEAPPAPDALAQRAAVALSGPEGCWVAHGVATWSNQGRFTASQGSATFDVLIQDHVWQGYALTAVQQSTSIEGVDLRRAPVRQFPMVVGRDPAARTPELDSLLTWRPQQRLQDWNPAGPPFALDRGEDSLVLHAPGWRGSDISAEFSADTSILRSIRMDRRRRARGLSMHRVVSSGFRVDFEVGGLPARAESWHGASHAAVVYSSFAPCDSSSHGLSAPLHGALFDDERGEADTTFAAILARERGLTRMHEWRLDASRLERLGTAYLSLGVLSVFVGLALPMPPLYRGIFFGYAATTIPLGVIDLVAARHTVRAIRATVRGIAARDAARVGLPPM